MQGAPVGSRSWPVLRPCTLDPRPKRKPRARGGAAQGLRERAAAAPATRGCPLFWRVYIAHELAAGRPDAARRVFLRGVHACAWAKARPHSGALTLCNASGGLAALRCDAVPCSASAHSPHTGCH